MRTTTTPPPPVPAPDSGARAPAWGPLTAGVGHDTVEFARLGRAWPPADGGAGAGRTRSWRLPFVVAGLVLAGAVTGGVTAVGASGGAERSAPPPTTVPADPPATAPATDPGATTTTTEPAPAPEPEPQPAPLPVEGVSASAAAPDSTDGCGEATTYGPDNTVDGAPATGWSIAGDGTGETLTLDLGGERRVRSVGLLPGYAKVDACTGVDRFPENRRPTSVTWTFDDGTEVSQPLRDAADLQAIEVDATSGTVRMRIDGVTPDPRRDFTVVSEVAVGGT